MVLPNRTRSRTNETAVTSAQQLRDLLAPPDLEIMPEMRPYNQDGEVIPILWMGNLVCSNRHLQGVAKA